MTITTTMWMSDDDGNRCCSLITCRLYTKVYYGYAKSMKLIALQTPMMDNDDDDGFHV